MRRFWGLGGLSWRELARRVSREILDDDVFGQAAKLAYYFLFATFPLLLILTTVLGFMAQTGSDVLEETLALVQRVAPRSGYRLVVSTLNEVQAGANGGKLSLGIIATLWAASTGVSAIMSALNQAYELEESRPWWKAKLLSIGLTIAFGVLLITAIVTFLYGSRMLTFLAQQAGLAHTWAVIWSYAQWPVVVGFVVIAYGLMYRYAPDREQSRWAYVWPGAIAGALLWLFVSFGLRTYLHYFNRYNATYGSLGAVIILLLWFYLTGAAILIGGEVNSEIENAAAAAGEANAHLTGEKRPGEHRRGWFRRTQPQS
jgi:membrane protein